MSETLPSSRSQIFLNLITKEEKSYTIALNPQGFKVVGHSLNTADTEGWVHFLIEFWLIWIFIVSEKMFMKHPTLFLTISAPHTAKHSGMIWLTNYLSCKNYKKKLATVIKVIKKKTNTTKWYEYKSDSVYKLEPWVPHPTAGPCLSLIRNHWLSWNVKWKKETPIENNQRLKNLLQR